MADVALTSIMATIKLEFLQPNPRVSLHDQTTINALLEMLSSFQAFVEKNFRGKAAIKDSEIKIRDFALKIEDDIEMQLSNFLLANNKEGQEKASQELHQTLRDATQNADELWRIINNISNEANEANETLPWVHRLKHASECENVSSLCSPKLEHKMVGRHQDFRVIKDQLLSADHRQVVSIVGMPGIGKTTLASSVYNDAEVASHFEV